MRSGAGLGTVDDWWYLAGHDCEHWRPGGTRSRTLKWQHSRSYPMKSQIVPSRTCWECGPTGLVRPGVLMQVEAGTAPNPLGKRNGHADSCKLRTLGNQGAAKQAVVSELVTARAQSSHRNTAFTLLYPYLRLSWDPTTALAARFFELAEAEEAATDSVRGNSQTRSVVLQLDHPHT